MEPISLTPLKSSLNRLKINLALAQDAEAAGDDVFKAFRDGCIKAFQYTYSLATATIHRLLENHPNIKTPLDKISFPALIRLAAEHGFIESPLSWHNHWISNSKISHVYLEEVAEEVYRTIPSFIADIEYLLNRMEVYADAS